MRKFDSTSSSRAGKIAWQQSFWQSLNTPKEEFDRSLRTKRSTQWNVQIAKCNCRSNEMAYFQSKLTVCLLLATTVPFVMKQICKQQIIHVMPVNDSMRHKFQYCTCAPKIQIERYGILFLHNANDKRELREEVTDQGERNKHWATFNFPL